MEYTNAPPQDKRAMAYSQPNPPPYQEGPSMRYTQPDQQFAGYSQQPHPGQPYPGQPYPGRPYPGQTVITVQPQVPLMPPEKDYLGYSIFTLLCCCMPLGIGALVYSIFTREANRSGNQAEAERTSRNARIFNHAALGLGLGAYLAAIVYIIVFVTTYN